jgi:hypothetical protein
VDCVKQQPPSQGVEPRRRPFARLCRRVVAARDAGPLDPGGSPEATRRAFNRRFLLDLAEDWQQHGREVFKRVRRESPASYLKVCAMLVPREMKLEHSGGVKAMTDEQLDRSIAFIEEMLAQREAGANAKVIEGDAEVVPSLPAPGSGGTKMPKA